MLSGDEKQCSRCRKLLPREEFARRAASRDGLQSYCRTCSSELARLSRPRKLAEAPAVPEGQKWCRRCERIKNLDDFPIHSGTFDGRQTYCRACFADIYRARREREGHVSKPSDIPPGHKFCRGCGQVKHLSAWRPREKATDGYDFRCRDCMSERARRRHLDRAYGMTEADVDALLEQQNGMCAICLRQPAVHIDHDHATGEVRGMLCFRCNAALGQLDDSVHRLHRAADYLQGRKIMIRQIQPGAYRFIYPEALPTAAPEPQPATTMPPLDIDALRAKARQAG